MLRWLLIAVFVVLGWIALSFLAGAGVSYSVQPTEEAGPARMEIGATSLAAPDPRALQRDDLGAAVGAFRESARALLTEHGYSALADASSIDIARVVALLAALVFIAALTFPISATLA